MNKKLIFLLLIALITRLYGIDNAVFDDEALLANSVNFGDFLGVNPVLHQRPPMTIWTLRLAVNIFGNHIWAMRLIMIFFSLLSIYFIYILTKKIYNEKIAFFSAFLMTFFFNPILNALQINDDSLLIFFYIASSYFFFEYERLKGWKQLLLTSFFLSLIILTNYVGGIFFIIILIYKLLKDKNIKRTIIDLFPIFLIAFIIFSIYPLIYLIINPETFLIPIKYVLKVGLSKESMPFLARIIILFLWVTPLLLGLTFLSLLKLKKENLFFYIWVIFGIIINLIIFKIGDFSRYFMFILPPLIILSSEYLYRIKLDKRYVYLGLIFFMIFYIIFIIFNLNSRIMFPHSMDNYFNAVKDLNFNFMFPYSISHGSWFGISFYAILFCSILSLLFFSLIFFKRYRKVSLILFISLGLSYNIFLNGEYLLHLSQPNINKIIYEMVDYTKENNLSYPIYSINKGILYYLYDNYLYDNLTNKAETVNYRIDDESIDGISDKLNKEGGTIVFLNFIAKIKKGRLDEKTNCKIIKTFSDKGQEMGYIYKCSKIK